MAITSVNLAQGNKDRVYSDSDLIVRYSLDAVFEYLRCYRDFMVDGLLNELSRFEENYIKVYGLVNSAEIAPKIVPFYSKSKSNQNIAVRLAISNMVDIHNKTIKIYMIGSNLSKVEMESGII